MDIVPEAIHRRHSEPDTGARLAMISAVRDALTVNLRRLPLSPDPPRGRPGVAGLLRFWAALLISASVGAAVLQALGPPRTRHAPAGPAPIASLARAPASVAKQPEAVQPAATPAVADRPKPSQTADPPPPVEPAAAQAAGPVAAPTPPADLAASRAADSEPTAAAIEQGPTEAAERRPRRP